MAILGYEGASSKLCIPATLKIPLWIAVVVSERMWGE